MYCHCNMCKIRINFYNIKMKYLQHPDKTSKTLKTYACNMGFQRNVILLLGRIEACHYGDQHGKDAGARSSSCSSGAGNSPMGWLHTKITPPWRLGGGGRGSVEAAIASRQRSGSSCA
jgi:hypothetical protein